MVGRAHTVFGPDIYLNALETIKPGEVFVQGGCNDVDAVFSPGWTHAYMATRGAVGVVVDGGTCCAGARGVLVRVLCWCPWCAGARGVLVLNSNERKAQHIRIMSHTYSTVRMSHTYSTVRVHINRSIASPPSSSTHLPQFTSRQRLPRRPSSIRPLPANDCRGAAAMRNGRSLQKLPMRQRVMSNLLEVRVAIASNQP